MIARRGPITHPLYSNIRNNLKWVIKQEEEEEEVTLFSSFFFFFFFVSNETLGLTRILSK